MLNRKSIFWDKKYDVSYKQYMALKRITRLNRLMMADVQIVPIDYPYLNIIIEEDIDLIKKAVEYIKNLNYTKIVGWVNLSTSETLLYIMFSSPQTMDGFFQTLYRFNEKMEIKPQESSFNDPIYYLDAILRDINAELNSNTACLNYKIKKMKHQVLCHLKDIIQHAKSDDIQNPNKRFLYAKEAIQTHPGCEGVLFQGGWSRRNNSFMRVNHIKDFFIKWCGGEDKFNHLINEVRKKDLFNVYYV